MIIAATFFLQNELHLKNNCVVWRESQAEQYEVIISLSKYETPRYRISAYCDKE